MAASSDDNEAMDLVPVMDDIYPVDPEAALLSVAALLSKYDVMVPVDVYHSQVQSQLRMITLRKVRHVT